MLMLQGSEVQVDLQAFIIYVFQLRSVTDKYTCYLPMQTAESASSIWHQQGQERSSLY
jgi:hypothetical protein